MTRLLLLALFAAAACGGDDTTQTDAAITNAAFGAACTTASDQSTECMSGVCTNTFDMIGHPVCSQKCTMLGMTDTTCPMGSMGQKCNMQGFCRP